MVRIDTHWRYYGLQVVRLENEMICLDVFPELGAKIYNFVHRPCNRNLLWHNPRIPPSRQSFRAPFNDVWSGGWDELIPNDMPTPTTGGETLPDHGPIERREMLPDHGEVWSQPSEWEIARSDGSSVTVRFVNHGHVLPTVFEKTITLGEGESFCTIRYRYSNLGRKPLDFLWNIHPALEISPATRLDVPARRGIVDPRFVDQFEGNSEYEWPYAVDRKGQKIDLRKVAPPESATVDIQCLPDISQGWYAATDTKTQVGFGLVFPTTVFPHLWIVRTFGGWRGLYFLILEAATGYPSDLAVAHQTGHCGHLEPNETIVAEVKAIAYSGLTSVGRIEPNGTATSGS